MKAKSSKISEFFENLWYHYKWLILIILVLGTVIVVSVVQMVEKGDPDLHILFIGQNYITDEGRKDTEKSLNNLFDDYNGDGELKMDLVELTVTTIPGESYDYTYQKDSLTRFEAEIRTGKSTIYIVEDSFYAKIRELNIASPLTTVFGEGNVPDYAYDEYSFRLRDLDIAEESGFCRFPRESFVCIRHSPENDEYDYARTKEEYEYNLDFFKKFTTYSSPWVMDRTDVGVLHADETALTNLSINKLDDAVYSTWKEYEKSTVASVDYKSIKLKKSQNGSAIESFCSEIKKEVETGKYGIVFIDSVYYNTLEESGIFTHIDEVFTTGSSLTGILDYGVEYDELAIKSKTGFSYMNGANKEEHSMVVCLVTEKYFSSEKEYNRYKEYYKFLMEYGIK
jgi:hypothetical protein